MKAGKINGDCHHFSVTYFFLMTLMCPSRRAAAEERLPVWMHGRTAQPGALAVGRREGAQAAPGWTRGVLQAACHL